MPVSNPPNRWSRCENRCCPRVHGPIASRARNCAATEANNPTRRRESPDANHSAPPKHFHRVETPMIISCQESITHSQTFPCISCRPKDSPQRSHRCSAANAHGHVRIRHSRKLASLVEISSPHENGDARPARQANSHSASLGNRYSRPVFRVDPLGNKQPRHASSHEPPATRPHRPCECAPLKLPKLPGRDREIFPKAQWPRRNFTGCAGRSVSLANLSPSFSPIKNSPGGQLTITGKVSVTKRRCRSGAQAIVSRNFFRKRKHSVRVVG